MSKTYERDEQGELIRAVTRGRESIRGAAARLGVPLSTAYGWVRAAGEAGRPAGATAAAPTFLELVPARATIGPRPATLTVRVGGAAIEVGHGFDAALLQAVVAALTEDAA